TRMGRMQPEKAGTSRKQFMLLDGLPILVHTVRKFIPSHFVTEIVIALRREEIEWVSELLQPEAQIKSLRLVEGGDSRQQSVENALLALGEDTDLVAVHDAVRPFVDQQIIENVVKAAAESGAAIAGIVPVDTVKQVHLHKVRQTLTRERMILTQTPQVFRYSLLRLAFERAREDNFTGTDESSLVERLEQVEVSVVAGSDRNIKITRPFDMEMARLFHSLEREGRKAS
ncbi:MAG: 2-C-methyl-D-erythritol 4-phosphate cytidylyltransferase, partial [Bryobacteraceae bacterium]